MSAVFLLLQIDFMRNFLMFKAPTPQNGKTHSNSSLAIGDELFD